MILSISPLDPQHNRQRHHDIAVKATTDRAPQHRSAR
jgi:hypothetical protein